MSNIEMKQRRSGIEMLKIIAMFGIVFFHCINQFATYDTAPFKQYADITKVTNDIIIFISQILLYLGGLGNLVFLISSAWFLVDNNNFKLNKIACMVLNIYVISVIFLLIFLGGGGKPNC